MRLRCAEEPTIVVDHLDPWEGHVLREVGATEVGQGTLRMARTSGECAVARKPEVSPVLVVSLPSRVVLLKPPEG